MGHGRTTFPYSSRHTCRPVARVTFSEDPICTKKKTKKTPRNGQNITCAGYTAPAGNESHVFQACDCRLKLGLLSQAHRPLARSCGLLVRQFQASFQGNMTASSWHQVTKQHLMTYRNTAASSPPRSLSFMCRS